jgi:peptidoglycan/LPS O-acetylase OafA/YrhL
MKTISRRLEECGGFGPGFDFVRTALAAAVLAWHTVAVVEGSAAETKATAIWPFVYSILPMFFALSGFLVTGSALRLPPRDYVLNRVFRIVPALAVDIILGAIVLGPIVTTLPLKEYFSDHLFVSYFFNIFGYIHYNLPGVFINNPLSGVVNGSLWTVPYEILCYIIMFSFIILGICRWKFIAGAAFIISITSCILYIFNINFQFPFFDRIIDIMFFSKGASLVPSFLVGSAIYLMKDFLPFDGRIAVAVVAAMVALSLFGQPSWFQNPIFMALSVAPLAYLVIWLGLVRFPKLPVLNRGDYSYGIYLYHFPILQLLQMEFGFASWGQLLVASVIPVIAFAMFSWHAIEKPILVRRKRFSRVGARLAAEQGRVAAGPSARDNAR